MSIDDTKKALRHHEAQRASLGVQRAAIDGKIECYGFVIEELKKELGEMERSKPC